MRLYNFRIYLGNMVKYTYVFDMPRHDIVRTHSRGSRCGYWDRPSWYSDPYPYYGGYYNPYVGPPLSPYRPPYYTGSYYNYYAPQLGLAPWWAD